MIFENAKVMEGSMAVAEAVRMARPKVISAYPITPQTHIVENLASFVADGLLNAEYVTVDSEFSAASVVFGASATGVRAYTASSSQGLLLMTEVLYNMAGTRLPVVITGANRTVSAPISIQPDHQDTMSLRDAGLIQIYVETCQEAHDTHIQAFKIAEDHDVLLPVMVCMDGWLLTHTYEPVELCRQEGVDSYLPDYQPLHYLTTKNPVVYGSYADDPMLLEFRYMIHDAMERAKGKIAAVDEDFARAFGRRYGGLIDTYKADDAEILLVAMGSVIGTAKDVVDDLRAEGVKAGIVKVRCYRPFPSEQLLKALLPAKGVAVLDQSMSMGNQGPLSLDVKSLLCNHNGPKVAGFIAGLSGREISKDTIRRMIETTRQAANGDIQVPECEFMNLNRDIL
jgi:pyruvate ferredoxin oxidoreductase alpha subunit